MPTALELTDAIQRNNIAAVEEILAADPSLVNARTEDGVSMVTLAQYYGNTDLVKLLVAHNAQIDLYDASAIGDAERAAGWLVMHPELVNTFSPDGFTPLGLASFFGHLDLVNLLLQAHADPNIASSNNLHVAPLHSAVAGNHYEIAAKLVEGGADVNRIQADGLTPLMGTAQNDNLELIKLLLAHGADLNARVDKNAVRFADMTALDIARQAGADQVVAYLETQHTTL